MTINLEEFIFLEKLFNVFYTFAENMHKFINQMNDIIKSLKQLSIFIDSHIIKSLILTHLKSHFQEFQSQKCETDLKMLSLDELFSQMIREDEIQQYHKDKDVLYDKKNFNVNLIFDEKRFNKNDNEK